MHFVQSFNSPGFEGMDMTYLSTQLLSDVRSRYGSTTEQPGHLRGFAHMRAARARSSGPTTSMPLRKPKREMAHGPERSGDHRQSRSDEMHPKSVSIAPPLGGTRDECAPETG